MRHPAVKMTVAALALQALAACTFVGPVTAEEVSVGGSGSGAIFLSCRGTGAVDAHLSGSGGLHLSGDARSLRSETTGSGRVHSKGLSLL